MAELIAAIRRGDEVEAKILMDQGADVNARNQWQRTPLHHAENEAMVKLLLDHGADVNARDQWQRTPLHIADNATIAKLLLDHGADVNARDEEQSTPLHGAKDAAIAKLLLDRGAAVNARNQWQGTPLHEAMNEAIAKLLLDHGADVNARDSDQWTPLHNAHNVAIARLLVNRGAQLTAVDEDGLNALHHRVREANLELCLFLVSRGLDPNIADNKGETALTLYGRYAHLNDDDEEKQEAVIQLLAAREAYEQRVCDEHWKKNWPLLNTLTSSGLRPMNAEVAALAAQQAASDKSVKLPGIPRKTKAQNIAYLNQAVFGRENEHLFLRHIVGFIPRTRFEEDKDDIEEKELLLEQIEEHERALKKAQKIFEERNTAMLQAQAQLKRAQDKVDAAQAHTKQVQAQQVQLQARIDALEQAQLSRRIEDSERGFPSESSNSASEGQG